MVRTLSARIYYQIIIFIFINLASLFFISQFYIIFFIFFKY